MPTSFRTWFETEEDDLEDRIFAAIPDAGVSQGEFDAMLKDWVRGVNPHMVGKKLNRASGGSFNTTYFSGQYSRSLGQISANRREEYGFSGVGLIVTPFTHHYLRSEVIKQFDGIGLDNGMFSKKGEESFTWDIYQKMVKTALAQEKRDVLGRLYFFAIPDKPFDWEETLKRFQEANPLVQKLRSYGAPAALVIQNGATTKDVPWGEIDVIFIGGDDQYKVGPDAEAIVKMAQEKGITVHMGRVNNNKRIAVASQWQVDSADGTYLMHELAKTLHEIERRNPRRRGETMPAYHERLKRIFHGEHSKGDMEDPTGWHLTEPEIIGQFIDMVVDSQFNNWVNARYQAITGMLRQMGPKQRLHKTGIQEIDRFLPHAPWLPQDEDVVVFDDDGYLAVDGLGMPVKNQEVFDDLNRRIPYRGTPEGIPDGKDYMPYINRFIARMRDAGIMPR